MKRIFLFFIFHFSLFTFHFARAQSEQQIIQKMSSAAAAIRTVECNFTQTRHTKMLKKELVSQGRMSCQLPDKLRWEYTSPRASTIVLGDEAPTRQNKFASEMAQMMMKLVAGQVLTDSQTFQVTAKQLPTEYEATLIPLKKNMKQMWTKLVLHFDIKQSIVTQVELYEKNGDFTIIDLRNIRINED